MVHSGGGYGHYFLLPNINTGNHLRGEEGMARISPLVCTGIYWCDPLSDARIE